MALSKDTMREMFWTMLLARRVDERAWVLHRQGKIAFHISGIGQEGAQVGAAYAIRKGHDWVTPYYRDLALMMALGYSARDFMFAAMGKEGEVTSGGRQMPSHFSYKPSNLVSHSAPVATQAPHAAGIGLAIKLNKTDQVVLSTVGEGSTSQGEWYEALNFSSVHNLPVVFIVENNLYAISVPVDRQMAVPGPADKACGLGLDGRTVDGTDMFAVYEEVHKAVEKARKGGGPSLIEARMYRITPHSSDDDDRTYRSREEVEEHKKSDPLLVARKALEGAGILTPKMVDEMEARAKEIVNQAVQEATDAPYPPLQVGQTGVYAQEVEHA